ncbi:serine/threonine-protein phosphatase 2A activator-like isoform X2 [Oscarella lobularis]|uniref:serine/threonine-protein phosphatase 2A activator-like isoform X2 n=1 Tax=Oscarella lobularis TaxID=121494 RepID=UPI003313702A
MMMEAPGAVQFVVPRREVTDASLVESWTNSQAYSDIFGLVQAFNEAAKGKACQKDSEGNSEETRHLVDLLSKLDKWIDEIPPIDQPQRFGNKAFRTWHERLEMNAMSLVDPLLPDKYKDANKEIAVYLSGGFGNATRIDYGTGHELSFAAFLCCLCKLRVLKEDDFGSVVCRVFPAYLDVTRKLQSTYNMEPAGSQGVWGLDDFQFLPYIWGSSQLIGRSKIEPSSFPDPKVANFNAGDFMFMSCIDFIYKMKTGPFNEHSSILYSISGLPTWSKINKGLIKMYKGEVLTKFPIIQHFPFGTLLPFTPKRQQ